MDPPIEVSGGPAHFTLMIELESLELDGVGDGVTVNLTLPQVEDLIAELSDQLAWIKTQTPIGWD